MFFLDKQVLAIILCIKVVRFCKNYIVYNVQNTTDFSHGPFDPIETSSHFIEVYIAVWTARG